MNESNNIYIAREVTLDAIGMIRIDEEGVFSSFKEAQDFLEHLRVDGEYESEPDPDDEIYRHEIIKYPLNNYENYNTKVRWVYKLNGDLISKEDPRETIPSPFDSVSFHSLFTVGDIVRVKSNYEEPSSNLIEENYGVISKVPVTKEIWQSSNMNLDEWDGAYIVLLISENTNLLYHQHVNEICLEKLKGELPDDLVFLNLLSDYSRNDGNVPNSEIIKKALHERIVVRKMNYFYSDFS